MTPQQLIDLKGYGSAEKQLRKMGKWKLTAKEEFEYKIGKIMNSIDDAISSIQSAEDDLEDSLSNLSEIQVKLED